jgi:hypothetical protein
MAKFAHFLLVLDSVETSRTNLCHSMTECASVPSRNLFVTALFSSEESNCGTKPKKGLTFPTELYVITNPVCPSVRLTLILPKDALQKKIIGKIKEYSSWRNNHGEVKFAAMCMGSNPDRLISSIKNTLTTMRS